MKQFEVLRDVVLRLQSIPIDYYLTGAIVGNYYGIPRLTHDIDVVVAMTDRHVAPFCRDFTSSYYISEEGIRSALLEGKMFSAIHPGSAMRVDFWIMKSDDFQQECFERRRRVKIFGDVRAHLATAEDLILNNLLWIKLTTSERQFKDVVGILAVSSSQLDMNYLEERARKLSVFLLLQQARHADLSSLR